MTMRAWYVGRFLKCPACGRILATTDQGVPHWPMGWKPVREPGHPGGVILKKHRQRRRKASDPEDASRARQDVIIRWVGRHVECDRCRETVET